MYDCFCSVFVTFIPHGVTVPQFLSQVSTFSRAVTVFKFILHCGTLGPEHLVTEGCLVIW